MIRKIFLLITCLTIHIINSFDGPVDDKGLTYDNTGPTPSKPTIPHPEQHRVAPDIDNNNNKTVDTNNNNGSIHLKPVKPYDFPDENPNLLASSSITHLTQSNYDSIEKALQNLPAKAQPANIKDVIENIKSGEQITNFIIKQSFHDAISKNLATPITDPAVIATLNNALNSNDQAFWDLIQNDKKMQQYAKKHNIPFTFQDFTKPENNMRMRDKYIRRRITDKTVLQTYTDAYQQSIVQLQWYLYGRSALQDIAFTSGMITLQDPNYAVFKFLDGYSELLNPGYKDHNSISFSAITQTGAYVRELSHWDGQKAFDNKNFGIDIIDAQGDADKSLPGNKSHLLYGLRTNGMTFIKWENYGVTFNPLKGDYSIIQHSLGYFEKKDQEDDPTTQRREKTPAEVIKKFNELYGKKLTSAQKQQIKTSGVSAMLNILDTDAKAKFTQYLTTEKKYDPATLNTRKGSEVILNLMN